MGLHRRHLLGYHSNLRRHLVGPKASLKEGRDRLALSVRYRYRLRGTRSCSLCVGCINLRRSAPGILARGQTKTPTDHIPEDRIDVVVLGPKPHEPTLETSKIAVRAVLSW